VNCAQNTTATLKAFGKKLTLSFAAHLKVIKQKLTN